MTFKSRNKVEAQKKKEPVLNKPKGFTEKDWR